MTTKPPAHTPPKKPLAWKTVKEPVSNLTQETIILLKLQRTNPAAYKLLKRWY